MPSNSALTINDGAATPVAHTFTPTSNSGTKNEWSDKSSATIAGQRKFHYDVSQPSSQRNTTKIVIGHYNPAEATLVAGGPVVVASPCSAQVTLNFAPDATLQQRKDTLAYVVNFLDDASVKQAILDGEAFW